MQIQSTPKYQISKPTFESRFVRNQTLRKAFKEKPSFFPTEEENQLNRQFLNAVKGLLNDGKDDIIKLSENGNETFLYVNGKRIGAQKHFINWDKSAEGTKNAIISLAEQERGIKRVYGYDSLSKDEIAATQEILDSYKQLKPEQEDFVYHLSRLSEEVQNKVSSYANKELSRLETIIFSRK